ncbi:MAG: glycosyltransferase, partial [Lentisphaeria bacterium]|nr:glycosyltransferase [Lentisphaeria bacterium]
MKIFIACGGTGGHFYPGLTIAQALQKENHQVTILLSGKETDKFAQVAQSKGIQSRIQVKYSRATSLIKKPLLMLKVMQNFICTWRLLRKEKPEVVLGMGGFANFSIYSARFCRKHTKLYVHEGNAVVGNANRWLSAVASKLLLSLEPTNKNRV